MKEKEKLAAGLINLKLKAVAGADTVLEHLSQIPGVVEIRRLFPEEIDPELATLYIVMAEPSSKDSVLKLLSGDQAVEFAEIISPRKLI